MKEEARNRAFLCAAIRLARRVFSGYNGIVVFDEQTVGETMKKDQNRDYSAGSFDEAEGALNADQAVEEALEGEPRAAELKQMRASLLLRRARLVEDFKAVKADETLDEKSRESESKKIRRDIAKLEEQIQVLGEEANISAFVEDAVRVGIEMRRMQN